MPNSKIKQVQVGTTTYDIEPNDSAALSVTNNNPSPAFGANATIGSVNGTNLTITIPGTNLAEASGGTDKTLVTTGDKYTWNHKSNLALGSTSTTAAKGNHTHKVTAAGSVSLNPNDTTDGTIFVQSINSTGASGSPTTRYLHKTTGSAAPNAHTHNVTVSGTTGNDSGDGVSVAKGDHTHSTSASGTASATGTTGQTVATGSVSADGTGCFRNQAPQY